MGYGIKLRVWGAKACFPQTGPEGKRAFCPVLPFVSARGILEAIYWKPQIRWVIDRIHVLNPIRLLGDCFGLTPPENKAHSGQKSRHEGSLDGPPFLSTSPIGTLVDVHYGIAAHLDVLDPLPGDSHPEARHLDIFRRRAMRGEFFLQPWLGAREYPASFAWVDPSEDFPPAPAELLGQHDLGWLRASGSGCDESGEGPTWRTRIEGTAAAASFRAILRDGVLEVPPPDPT